MRILVLDDMDVRHDKFKDAFKGHIIDEAYTAEEAIHHLSMRKYDLVQLDHDLAQAHYVDGPSSEPTGLDVAVYISEMPAESLPTQVIIHSWNPVGADRMYDQLQGLGMFVSKKPA